MTYTVGEVARLAGITVRALHHYDEIGLLRPEGRSESGYRLYDQAELEVLREILFFRELGYSLEAIKQALHDPDHDRLASLANQRQLLKTELERMASLITAIDAAIEARQEGVIMSPNEMFEVFGDFDPTEYDNEVDRRWSGPLLDESRRRTASYRKQDWQTIKDEGDDILARFATALRAGDSAQSQPVMDIAEEHRRHIDRWFYPCPHEHHSNLATLYVTDPSFTSFWDDTESGLAIYVSDAIDANAITRMN